MPTLLPPPTIPITPAPVKVQAQQPRSTSANDAIKQESTPFEMALNSAGQSIDKAAKKTTDTPQDDKVAEEAGDGASNDILADGAESGEESAPEQRLEPEPGADEAAAKTEDGSEAEAETEADVDASVAVLVALALNDPLRMTLPVDSDAAARQQAAAGESETPQGQPSPQPGLQTAESSTLLDETAPSTPATPASAEATVQSIASAVTTKQTADPTPTPTPTDAPLEAGAIPTGAPADAQTSSDDAQQQRQQPGRESGQAAFQTPESEPVESSAAQRLRPLRVDPAPTVTEPVSVEAQAPRVDQSIQGARPTATPQSAPAPSLGTVDADPAFNAAVQRGLAAAVRQQGGTLTIKLDPPTLGKLTIRMTIDQGKVEASFDAQTAQARDLLIENASTLRAQLRSRGLTVERLEVIGAASAASRPGHSTANTGDQPGANGGQDEAQHDAGGGQSRGRSETGEDQSSTSDGATSDAAGIAGEPLTLPFEAQLRYSVSAIA